MVDLNSFLKENSSPSIQLMYVLEVVKLCITVGFFFFFFKMEMVRIFTKLWKLIVETNTLPILGPCVIEYKGYRVATVIAHTFMLHLCVISVFRVWDVSRVKIFRRNDVFVSQRSWSPFPLFSDSFFSSSFGLEIRRLHLRVPNLSKSAFPSQ